MRQSLPQLWTCACACIISIAAACAQAQTPAAEQIATEDGKQQLIPSKVMDFKAVDTDPTFSLPLTSVDYPHCLSDGSLVLRSIDWEALKNRPKGQFPKYDESVSVVVGKKTKTLLTTPIPGMTSTQAMDIYPADSGVYVMYWGTKEQPGGRGPGKSPDGILLSAYHSYVARFDLDGTYKDSTELEAACDLTQSSRCDLRHLAVFPSGDMLVTESDRQTSSLRLLYVKSSGEVVKPIEVPAGRKPMDWGADPSSNPELRRQATAFLSSVYFTAVKNNIVIWRANSNDPLVEVTDGGGVREVPIEIPHGWRFADMVPSNDRWVVHFRTENTAPTEPMNSDRDAYFELRPQDGSLMAKIVEKGDIPLSIACESNGSYTSFRAGSSGKAVLLKAD